MTTLGFSRRFSALVAAVLGAAAIAPARTALALDTTETWDRGAFDVEAYTRLEQTFERDRTVAFDALVGYGAFARFSVFAAGSFERSPEGSALIPVVGVFGTPIESEHVDLDLFLTLSSEGSCVSAAPAFELNLDAEPDLAAWGVFVRGDSALHEHTFIRRVHDPVDDEPWHLGLALGAYATLGTRHQVFAQIDGSWIPKVAMEPGDLALGYNARLSDALELVTSVAFEDVVHRSASNPGFLTGVIATIPP